MDTQQNKNRSEKFLDLVFPYFCLLCKTEVNAAPDYLCAECKTKILRPAGASCIFCTSQLSTNEAKDVCKQCRRQKPYPQYKAAYAPTIYHSLARQYVIQMKSAKKKSALNPMAQIMANFALKNMADIQDYNLIVPVPMHWTKLIIRGFNQSQELAQRISKELNIHTVQEIIARRMFTNAQKSLSKQQRSINARTAFKSGKNINQAKDKNILLIDDVLTTGATAAECSRILIEAGAKKVSVLVFSGTQNKD